MRCGRSSVAARSMSAGFGLGIAGGPGKSKELRVSRHLAPVFFLVAALAPIAARAQVNIDQDKSPAHIFASDCSVCHKTTRGLANGRGTSALTGFLAEHYTSSREEAASVAAYVLSMGGGVGTAVPVREQKPDLARGRAATAEAKPEAKPEPKTRRAAKPEQQPAAAAKPRRTVRERVKPKEERSASVEPGTPAVEKKPAAGRRGAAARVHSEPKPEGAAPPVPAAPANAVAAAPAAAAQPVAPPISPPPSAAAQPPPAAAPPADDIPD